MEGALWIENTGQILIECNDNALNPVMEIGDLLLTLPALQPYM